MMIQNVAATIYKVIVQLFLIFFVLLLVDTGSVFAQSTVTLNERELNFHGRVNEPIQRTFTLLIENGPLKNLSFVRHDLINKDTGAVILSGDISIDPDKLDTAEHLQQFTVSVEGGKRPGNFTGTLDILYDGQPENAKLTMTCNVTLESVPSVDAEVSSKNPVLPVIPSWNSLPFGRPSVNSSDPDLGQVGVSLVQNAEGKAIIENAEILPLRSLQGYTLPKGTITIVSPATFPFDLSEGDATSLELVAKGENLRAGEYTGTLFVKVRNQPTSVQVPLKVRVKDGPLLALVILAIGPILGAFFSWRNKIWLHHRKLKQDIERLEERIENKKLLQGEEQKEANRLIFNAKKAMMDGAQVNTIEEQFDIAKKFVDAALHTAEQFLQENITPLHEELEKLEPGKTFVKQMKDELKNIEGWFKKGHFQSFKAAKDKFDEVQKDADALKEIIKKFNSLSEDKRPGREVLDKASSINEMKQALDEASKGVSKAPTFMEPLAVGKGRQRQRDYLVKGQAAWDHYTLKFKWVGILITFFAYIVTCAVGFITLYLSSPIFGADVKDYVTLLLWGVSSNAIGVQTINLKAMYNITKETGKTD